MMVNPSLESCPVQMREIVFQSMPPDTILLNLDNGYYYSTNSIGAAVWAQCDGVNSIRAIMTNISMTYDKSIDEIADDILFYIQDMTKEGLVKIEKS